MSKSLLICLPLHKASFSPEDMADMKQAFNEHIAQGMTVDAASKTVMFARIAEAEQEITQIEQVIEADIAKKAKKGPMPVAAKPEKVEPRGPGEPIRPDNEQILKRAGLFVKKTMTKPKKAGKKPRPVWEVSGKLEPYLKIIKDLGGRKWGDKYSFWHDPAWNLAEAVKTRKAEKQAVKKPETQTLLSVEKSEFVRTKEGSIDFGYIDEKVAKKIKRQSAPIRLQKGNKKVGEIHIQQMHGEKIKAAGYKNVRQFVLDVSSKYHEIRKGNKGALLLVKPDGKSKIEVIRLRPGEDKSFYNVETAFIARPVYMKKYALLWERSEPISPVSGQQAPLASASLKPGQAAPNAQGQSKVKKTLTPAEKKVKPEVKSALTKPVREMTWMDARHIKTAMLTVERALNKVLGPSEMTHIKTELKPFLDLSTINAEYYQRSLREHGGKIDSIAGLTTINNLEALVQIAYTFDQPTIEKTAFHESFHVASKWLLPADVYDGLMKYFKGNEENAADAFSGFAMKVKGMELNQHPNWLKAIFIKLKHAFTLVRNALQGKGWMVPEDVFSDILRSKYRTKRPVSVIESRIAIPGKPVTAVSQFAAEKTPDNDKDWAKKYITDVLGIALENPDNKEAQAKAERIKKEQEWFKEEWPKALYQSSKDVIKAFKMGKKKGWVGMKPDTTFLERWLQSPEFYFEKVPAAWRVYEASLDRADDYNQNYNDLTENESLLAEIQTFKKQRPKEYGRLQKLIVRADMIKATHGPKSLRELGFSDQAINAWVAFRKISDNGFDRLYAEMAEIIREYEALGLPLPEVATWIGDKELVVNLKMALAQMGKMRGWYFPRQRKPGRWMLIAKKEGTNPILEFFETGPMANLRDIKLTKQGYVVSKTKPKKMPEDVFEMAGKTIGLNAMINQALERTIPENMPTYEEYGLQPIMRTGPTGRKDFIVRGPSNKQVNSVMKSLGGRFWSSAPGEPKAWHFTDAPSDMKFRVLRALTTSMGIPGAAETDLLFAHALATEVANVVKGRGFRSAMISRRQGAGSDVYVGYETDLLTVASRYVTGLSAGLAKKEMAAKMVQAVTGTDVRAHQFKSFEEYLDEVKRRRIDPDKQDNIFRDVKAYMQEMLRNQEVADRLIGTIKGITVLKYLGFRLSSPLVNLTSLVTSVPATMHALGKVPWHKTFGYLVNAMGDYNIYAQGDKKKLSPDIVAMFDHIRLKGWDTAQYNLEALAVLRSKLGNSWRKLLEMSMFMFGSTEQFIRVVTIMGSYMALKDQGKTTIEEMKDLSKRVSDRSHGVYGRTTYPYVAQGQNLTAQGAKMFYVFSKFSHTYLQNMWDMGWKRHQWVSLLHMAFAPVILSGAGTFPLLWPVFMGILRKIFDVDEPEERFYSWFDDHLGDFMGNFVRYGLAGLGGYGVSLKGSLAIDPFESFPTSLPEVLGAPGNVLTDVYYGGKSLMKGDTLRAVEKVGPRFTGSMIQAYREEMYGVTTRKRTPKFLKGKKMEPENLDTIWRFLNFNPAHMAKIKEQKWSEQRLIAKYRDLRSDIYSRIRAYAQKPQSRRSEGEYLALIADIDEYNKRVVLRKLYEIDGISIIDDKSIAIALKLKK